MNCDRCESAPATRIQVWNEVGDNYDRTTRRCERCADLLVEHVAWINTNALGATIVSDHDWTKGDTTTPEGEQLAPETILGFCDACYRTRWLAWITDFDKRNNPHGACFTCARESEEL